MKITFRLLLIFLLLHTCCILRAQTIYLKNGKVIEIDREKFTLLLYSDRVEFARARGVTISNFSKKIDHKDIRYISEGNLIYIALPIKTSGKLRLHQVMAYNDSFVLTKYIQAEVDLYFVFSRNTKQPLLLWQRDNTKGKAMEAFDAIKTYFEDCPDLINTMGRSLAQSATASPGIHRWSILPRDFSLYRCKDSKEFNAEELAQPVAPK
jgi:hypothetical protein